MHGRGVTEPASGGPPSWSLWIVGVLCLLNRNLTQSPARCYTEGKEKLKGLSTVQRGRSGDMRGNNLT